MEIVNVSNVYDYSTDPPGVYASNPVTTQIDQGIIICPELEFQCCFCPCDFCCCRHCCCRHCCLKCCFNFKPKCPCGPNNCCQNSCKPNYNQNNFFPNNCRPNSRGQNSCRPNNCCQNKIWY